MPEFKISKTDKIEWVGNNTQKGTPVDLIIGNYQFSLKEESFILENMGLYSLLNYLTNSHYTRGLHVFKEFALLEYDNWFKYTWTQFVKDLLKNNGWTKLKGNDCSIAKIEGDQIKLTFNQLSSIVPVSITTNSEYMQYTNSITREKVFSKWINEQLSRDKEYVRLKKMCSTIAGNKLTNKILCDYKNENIFSFFRIYDFTYYYAKTTLTETKILKVPSKSDFDSIIEFSGCKYEIPNSQLNIISAFKNKYSGATLEFRNECRFSHGQFNGTPEAKMYIVKDTPLTSLYIPITS